MRNISIHRWLVILFAVVSINSFPQNPKIDSLKSLLGQGINKQYPDVICELGYEYLVLGNYSEARRYSEMLLSFGRLGNDSLQIVRGMAINASALRRSGYLDSATSLYLKTLPTARKNGYDTELMNISNSLGVLYAYAGHYDKALKFLFESLFIREKLGNKFDISVNLQNIGFVYYKLHNFEKAVSFSKRSLELRKAAKDYRDLNILLVNMGLCYAELQNYEKAKKYVEEAFTICGNTCDDNFLMHVHLCLGIMSANQKEYDIAEKEFLESYTLSKKIDDTRFLLDNLIELSDIYLKTGRLALAEKYLFEAEGVITNDPRYKREFVDLYSLFSSLYSKSRNYKKLAIYQKKYIVFSDSLFNDEVRANLMKAEASYVEREHQARIESQNKILALKEEVIYRQKIANASVGAIACLVIFIAVILAKRNKEKQLRNKLLDEQVKERTKEIEMNWNAMQRAGYERDVLISTASSDLQSSIATLKGLSSIASKEIDHPLANEYWKQLDNTSKGLSAVLNKLLHSYKNNHVS